MDRAVFLSSDKKAIRSAYAPETIADSPVLAPPELDCPACRRATAVFSTWGMPALSQEEIARLFPELEELYYAAGSVQAFARPFLKRGVRVFSAWAANAVPVAEFALAQILLANKGYFQLDARCRRDGYESARAYAEHFKGNYKNRVGILGAGMVGRKLIELLRPFELSVLVFDPFLSDDAAKEMNVRKSPLEEIFSQCPVVSNHLANNEKTRGLLDYGLFSRMSPFGVFINTGRNAQVSQEGLVRAMREEPGRTALLDVTDPYEPLPPGHAYLGMPNILISPHRAGSAGGEVRRMGEYMAEEYRRVRAGEPARFEVTREMLETMA